MGEGERRRLVAPPPVAAVRLATLPLVAVLGRRVGGRRLAGVAPPLLALLYLFGVKAAEARAYSLETLLVTIGWYDGHPHLRLGVAARASLRWWGLLVLLAFVGPLAHGLFPLFVLAWWWRSSLSPTPPTLVRSVPIVVATGVVLLLDVHGAIRVGGWVPPTTLHRVVLARPPLHQHQPRGQRAHLSWCSWCCPGGSPATAYWRSRTCTPIRFGLQARDGGVLPLVGAAAPGRHPATASRCTGQDFLDRYLAPVTPMVALALRPGCSR